jgi:hypothetical protein
MKARRLLAAARDVDLYDDPAQSEPRMALRSIPFAEDVDPSEPFANLVPTGEC